MLKKVLSLLDARQKRQVVVMGFNMLLISVLEAIGIGAIIPLMTVLAEPKRIQSIGWLRRIYQVLNPSSYSQFVVYLALAMLGLVLIKNLVIGLSYRRQYRFAFNVQKTISVRLLSAYLTAPYQYFLKRNTAELLKNIQGEIPIFVSFILIPGLMLVSEGVITVTVLGLLLMVNATLTIMISLFLTLSLALIFYVVRRRTDRIGLQRKESLSESYKIATKALSSVKDIKVLGQQQAMADEYEVASRRYSESMAYQTTLSAMPRLTVETLAFIALITILLYSVEARAGVGGALPLMALFAMAAVRLIPSFNRIFMSVLQLRYYTHTLNVIHHAFDEVRQISDRPRTVEVRPISFREKIELRGVTYSYPGSEEPTLRDVNLVIEKGKAIGLVGLSGSGKTTLVDILLGLLEDYSGEIRVDGRLIDRGAPVTWEHGIGYVPQQTYLADDSIAANVAFGVPPSDIDMEAVKRAIEVAQLSEFVSTLPNGLMTEIGERGIRFSGGQRQRLGIARALYHNPGVLVMDEATSALDGLTEWEITSAIERLSGSKTLIVIAHRLTTVERCDTLYLLEGGRITASGTYSQLAQHSAHFRKLTSK